MLSFLPSQNRTGPICSDAGAELTPVAAPAMLPVDLLDEDETIILLSRPSLLFIPLSCATGISILLFITFFLAWCAKQPWQFIGWSETEAFLLGGALIGLRAGWQTLEWWMRLHILTDRRLVTRSGVLRVYYFQAPLRKIQHSTVVTRVRERLFGLGTIAFATAGSDSFETFWVMVRKPLETQRIVLEAVQRYGR